MDKDSGFIKLVSITVAIAHALSVEVFTILNVEMPEEQPESFVPVRAKDRRKMQIRKVSAKDILEAINHLRRGRAMDGYALTPGSDFSEKPMAHEGQEFKYNGKYYILLNGDCCSFNVNMLHYGRSLGKNESKALIFFSMPSKKQNY